MHRKKCSTMHRTKKCYKTSKQIITFLGEGFVAPLTSPHIRDRYLVPHPRIDTSLSNGMTRCVKLTRSHICRSCDSSYQCRHTFEESLYSISESSHTLAVNRVGAVWYTCFQRWKGESRDWGPICKQPLNLVY